MSERALALLTTAEEQIDDLVSALSHLDNAALRLPCPGREKLGDGTVGSSARHTADRYQRIAAFVQTSDRMSSRPAVQGGHRVPRLLRALGHGAHEHAEHHRGAGEHDAQCTADTIDVGGVITQLLAARETLADIARLTDCQLDAIPPRDSFRFCDGQRTLEGVLASLLKHQRHQVQALIAATPRPAG